MPAIDEATILRLNNAAEWFDGRPTAINEACAAARKTLRANNLMLKDVFPWKEVHQPWFVAPRRLTGLSDDEMKIVEDSRRFGLRSRVFGLGLKFLLTEMQKRELAYSEFEWSHLRVRGVCSYRVMAVQHEFAAVALVDGPDASLSSIATRFDYAPNRQPARLVESLLFPMTDLGLWHARADDVYGVRMGAVGAAFHSKVFLPVLREFEPKLGEEE